LTNKGSWLLWSEGCGASREPSDASTPLGIRTDAKSLTGFKLLTKVKLQCWQFIQ